MYSSTQSRTITMFDDGTADMNAVINRYFHENVQLEQADAKTRRKIAFSNVEKILNYVNEKDPRFGKNPIRVGSYWQGLKVDKADEFDYSITLEGVGSYVWNGSSYDRFYEYSKPRNPNHSTIPEDLDIVMSSVRLPSPPKSYHYAPHDKTSLSCKPAWKNKGDLTRPPSYAPGNKIDIVPFLAKKRLKELLTEAKRDLDLRGEVRQSRKVSGPALTMFFTVGKKEIAIDFAPIIQAQLPFPSWISWPRPNTLWPSQKKIEEIKDYGINLVAKEDFWWMLSFAELEKKLVDKVDADDGKRKQLHRVMKSLNGEFWCDTSKAVISSYILKNIWFWEMEKFPCLKDWDNEKLWTRLRSMTSSLLKAIHTRHLKQYFYPEINLLEKKDRKQLDIAAQKISNFLENPINYMS